MMEQKKRMKMTREYLNKMFPIVRASNLSLDDAFMHHTPSGAFQERIMQTLITQIPKGLQDFRRPRIDPSFDEKLEMVFEEGRKPGVCFYPGREWKEAFKEFMPEKHSDMMSVTEYEIFCGVYIKELVAKGYSVERAWYEVCNESCKQGHFWDSPKAKTTFEPTGSRPQGAWCDLGNTRKIITDKSGFYYSASGAYKDSSQMRPIAGIDEIHYMHLAIVYSVGLMRMDV